MLAITSKERPQPLTLITLSVERICWSMGRSLHFGTPKSPIRNKDISIWTRRIQLISFISPPKKSNLIHRYNNRLSHSFLDLRKVSNVCDLVKHNHEIHEISVETPLRTFNFIFTDESKKKTFLYGLRSLIF